MSAFPFCDEPQTVHSPHRTSKTFRCADVPLASSTRYWWIGTGNDPHCASRQMILVVQIQHCGSRAPACRQADDQQPLLLPREMVGPFVLPGIEQVNVLSAQRVRKCLPVRTQFVAPMATESQVCAIVRSAQRRGLQMLDLQTIGENLLRASAISALELSVLRDEVVKRIRYPLACQCRILLRRANNLSENVLPTDASTCCSEDSNA